MRQISINKRVREDSMYVTLDRKVLKLSDDVMGCGVRDGSTLHVNHRVRGGGDPGEQEAQQAEQDDEEEAKKERQTPLTCQVKTKEESLEDMCSRPVRMWSSRCQTQDCILSVGCRLLGVLSQGTDDQVDRKNRAISVPVQEGFKCGTRAGWRVGEILEIWGWLRRTSQLDDFFSATTRRALEVAEKKREDNQEGMHQRRGGGREGWSKEKD